jgi:deoxyribonuclease (pyrimidine dimer)
MTRINCGVPVKELHNKHLLAEHREIVRIPNAVKSGKAKLDHIPSNFRLGAGHVKFFYDKLWYLQKRYIELYKECLRRGFLVQNYLTAFEDVPPDLFNDYAPTVSDAALVRARILERLIEMNKNK